MYTVTTAVLLCCAVAAQGTRLIEVHGAICRFLLALARVPLAGMDTIDVFAQFGPATVPVTPIPSYGPNPVRATVLFIVSVLLLLAIHRRVALARNFVVFLITLLLAAAGVIAVNPAFQFSSSAFTQIWLRTEVLVWLLLPWVSGFFVLIHPSTLRGVFWVLAAQIYAFLWSALRLAFCLGVLHYTGILFLPVLWFCLGLLSDSLFVLLFYSGVVYHAGAGIWGRRSAWQS